MMIYSQPIRRHYHPKYTFITLAPVSYLRSLVVRAVHRHRTGVASIPARGPYSWWIFLNCSRFEFRHVYNFQLGAVRQPDIGAHSLGKGRTECVTWWHGKVSPKFCTGSPRPTIINFGGLQSSTLGGTHREIARCPGGLRRNDIFWPCSRGGQTRNVCPCVEIYSGKIPSRNKYWPRQVQTHRFKIRIYEKNVRENSSWESHSGQILFLPRKETATTAIDDAQIYEAFEEISRFYCTTDCFVFWPCLIAFESNGRCF